MKWPWSRGDRQVRRKSEEPASDYAVDAERAQAASDRADQALQQTLDAGAEVDRVAASLAKIRRRNSFAEMMERSFREIT